MAHPHELSEYGGFPKERSMNHYAMEQMRGPDRPFIQFLVLVDNRVSPVLDLVISNRFPTFGLATYSTIALLPMICSWKESSLSWTYNTAHMPDLPITIYTKGPNDMFASYIDQHYVALLSSTLVAAILDPILVSLIRRNGRFYNWEYMGYESSLAISKSSDVQKTLIIIRYHFKRCLHRINWSNLIKHLQLPSSRRAQSDQQAKIARHGPEMQC